MQLRNVWFYSLFNIYKFILYEDGHIYDMVCIWRSEDSLQKLLLSSLFLPSLLWLPGMELRLPNLAESAFTHWAVSLSLELSQELVILHFYFFFFELVKINLNCNNLFPVLEDTHGSLSLMGVSPSTDKLLSWHHPCKDLISTWTACDIKHVHKGRIIFYWQSVSTMEKDASW